MTLLKVFILSLLSMIAFSCATPQTAMEREAKKAERKLIQYKAFSDAATAMADQKFIVKVNLVVFRLGQAVSTTPSTNFVTLSGTDASIQVAFDFVMGGPNFLGGVTVDGEARNISMKTDNRGNINYHMDISGVNVMASVDIKLFHGDNKCEVVVYPLNNREKITLRGNIFPESRESVFKGRSL